MCVSFLKLCVVRHENDNNLCSDKRPRAHLSKHLVWFSATDIRHHIYVLSGGYPSSDKLM